MKFLCEHFVLKKRILCEVKVDSVPRFDVFEFLDFQFVHKTQHFLLLSVQYISYFPIVYKLQAQQLRKIPLPHFPQTVTPNSKSTAKLESENWKKLSLAKKAAKIPKKPKSPLEMQLSRWRPPNAGIGENCASEKLKKGYGRDPEVRYPLYDVVAFLEIRLAKFVVLLLDFEDLVARLLVEAVDLILTAVYFFQSLLNFQIEVQASLLRLAQLLIWRRHGRDCVFIAIWGTSRNSIRRFFSAVEARSTVGFLGI